MSEAKCICQELLKGHEPDCAYLLAKAKTRPILPGGDKILYMTYNEGTVEKYADIRKEMDEFTAKILQDFLKKATANRRLS